MGRDLAAPGALVPSGGTQEALRCALSLFVIRLSALFTEEETEAWKNVTHLPRATYFTEGRATILWAWSLPLRSIAYRAALPPKIQCESQVKI